MKEFKLTAKEPTTSTQDAQDRLEVCERFLQRPLSLKFISRAVENQFLLEVASGRLPILISIASFDAVLLLGRLIASANVAPEGSGGRALWSTLAAGVRNLGVLYSLMALIHWRSKQSGTAVKQGEWLLAALVSATVSLLVLSPSFSVNENWIFTAFFLICTSSVLRLRWLVSALALAVPVAICISQNLSLTFLPASSQAGAAATEAALPAFLRSFQLAPTGEVPVATVLHLVIAWAAGALMGFLSDSSRRQSFANHRLALAAAATELGQVRARVAAEKELASAQALAQAQSILVERERAANEAKSEFISMLCHEIRTPLNGCLASAEMLLQTQLDDDQKDLAHTVRVSGSILLSTVSNFLDFFKLEAGKSLDVVRTPVDLGMLVADVHRIIEAMIGAGGEVELRAPELTGAPRTVLGDPARLCGILLNMYMNAAKFTRRGSIGLRVHRVGADYRPLPPPSVEENEEAGEEQFACGGSMEEVENEEEDEEERQNNEWERSVSGSSAEDEQQQREGLGGSAVQHDSFSSLPRQEAYCQQQQQEENVSTPSVNLRMSSVRYEGDGWLSTSSLPKPCGAEGQQEGPTTEREGVAWIAFEVHDSGIGVPERSLGALFADYVQGDIADMDKPRTRSGTGLGLAICGRQVDVLGGVIGALSKPQRGSVFWFKVPMAVPAEPNAEAPAGAERVVAAGLAEQQAPAAVSSGVSFLEARTDSLDLANAAAGLEHSWNAVGTRPEAILPAASPAGVGALATAAAAAAATAGVRSTPLAGMRVLVAEDNLINRKVACKVLQSLGAVCEVSSNGQEAVEAVEASLSSDDASQRLDAVLMDMCMPIMDGVEATRKIRALGCTLPIVAMTANALERDCNECLAAGMDGFLSKPVLREQLAECLVEVVRESREKHL